MKALEILLYTIQKLKTPSAELVHMIRIVSIAVPNGIQPELDLHDARRKNQTGSVHLLSAALVTGRPEAGVMEEDLVREPGG